jgi:hypothetical protein
MPDCSQRKATGERHFALFIIASIAIPYGIPALLGERSDMNLWPNKKSPKPTRWSQRPLLLQFSTMI